MTVRRWLCDRACDFARDEDGTAGIMVLSATVMMFGAAAIAIDLGSVFLAKRQLQGVADTAVIAAVDSVGTDADAAARDLIAHSLVRDARLTRLTPGTYARDAAIDPDARFTASSENPTAVQLTLERDVPLFFYRALTGRETMTISVAAVAARQNRAAFSIGSRLGSVSGGAPNAILSALAGADLQLTVDDLGDLDGTSVELLAFVDALRIRLGREDDTYGDVLNDDIPLTTVIEALGDAAADPDTAAILAAVAEDVGSETIRVADYIDLGPLAQTDFNDGSTRITVSAMAMLTAALQTAHGDSYALDVALAVPGLSNTRLRVVGGNEIAHSPWISVGSEDDVTVRTARTRLYLETTAATALTSIATIRLPVYVELAGAQARLADISCPASGTQGVTLAVKPSIGTAAIAAIDDDALASLTTDPALAPKRIANVTGISVDAYAELNIGGATEQSMFFSKNDIAAGAWKSASTHDAVTALVASLVAHTDLQVRTPLGSLLVPSTIRSSIGSTLTQIAPAVDGVLNDVTRVLGVRLGIADTRVNGMRCGAATLVA